MMELYNRHYITIDDQSRVIDIWSDGPHPDRDISSAICVNEKGGYQFDSIPGAGINPSYMTMKGVPLYKWDGKQIIKRTNEEVAADTAAIPELPPTPQEQLRADVDFLAAVNGITL